MCPELLRELQTQRQTGFRNRYRNVSYEFPLRSNTRNANPKNNFSMNPRITAYTRRAAILSLFVIGAGIQLNAQRISLLTFTGYTFADKINFSGGYGQIEDGFQ